MFEEELYIEKLKQLSERDLQRNIDLLGLKEYREITCRTPNRMDVEQNYHTQQSNEWYLISDELRREVRRYFDSDLFPYRIAENVMLIESDVELNWKVGVVGRYTVRVSDLECKMCGIREGVELEVYQPKDEVIRSECLLCGEPDANYTHPDQLI